MMAESSQQSSNPTMSPEGSNDSSASGEPQSTKRGRPSKWNKSRQRKLARLYLYSTLPPKDISLALEDKENNWKPGKESTVKTVNALLDNQPRWLRPKNREEMDGKINELKKVQKKGEASTPKPQEDADEYSQSPFMADNAVFSETPLQDLFAETPTYPPNMMPNHSPAPTSHPACYSLPFDLPFLEHSILPTAKSPQPQVKRERTNSNHLYSYQDIARGARGIRYHTFYQCPICNQTNAHSDSYLDQMQCAFRNGRDRVSPDHEGMTPAHALIMYQRNNNDDDITPETPEQTAELFRTLFPEDDATLRRALYILDPAGHTLIHNITKKGFNEILDYIEEITAASDEPVLIEKPVVAEVDQKSLSTYMTTSSLKKRLPQYSTRYLKGISRLIKTHSISESSRESTPREPTPKRVPDLLPSIAPTRISTMSQLSHSTVSILPDAFLSIDRHIQRQGICIPGFKAHDAKTCWCHVLEGINSRVWVGNTGLVDNRVSDPPENLHFLNLKFKDNFGNTALHMLAARGAPWEVMIQALERGVNGNEKNSADQTFMHVIRRQILRTLAEDGDTLMWVLQRLNVFNVRFHECDVIGRTFLHILVKQAERHQPNSLVTLQLLNVMMPTRRDVYGYKPNIAVDSPAQNFVSYEPTLSSYPMPSVPQAYGPSLEPREFRRPNSIIHQPLYEEPLPPPPPPTEPVATFSPSASSEGTATLDDHEAFVLRHARLLEIARGAFTNPRIEDTEGQNGLQCLAEASLTLSIDSSQVTKPFSNKRKVDGPEPVRATAKLNLRYELVEKLVAAGVDVNNYDKAGNTVLMSFVKHMQDGEDDKTLAKLFRHLIDSGANLHWRNRQGETALHIAVKLGRKVATKTLVERGSNVHARTAEGLGILALAEIYYLKAKDDPPLYSSIMACMAMCIQHDAVASPTLVMEWMKRN